MGLHLKQSRHMYAGKQKNPSKLSFISISVDLVLI